MSPQTPPGDGAPVKPAQATGRTEPTEPPHAAERPGAARRAGATRRAAAARRAEAARQAEAAQRADATEAIESVVQVRRARADRATRGVLAALLCFEALVVLLLPRTIAQTDTGLNAVKTIVLITLAVVLVATGFLLRRPWGIGLGSAGQLALLATGGLEPVMFAVAAVFIALWAWVLTMRRDLVGTPGGWRMLTS